MNIVEILTSASSSDDDGETYEIGALATELGISTRTIRFYEEKGIVSPQREGTSRIFGKRDRARLILALRGKKFGFSLDEVKEYLELYNIEDGKVSDKQLDYLLNGISQALSRLEERKEYIELTIAELNEIRDLAEVERKKNS
ncbi:MAG: MerR family transcriptional regulator [Methyloligellaceae bacterium]